MQTFRSNVVMSGMCIGTNYFYHFISLSSLVVFGLAVLPYALQHRGFDPPLGKFSGRGDFSLGVNMGLNSIPQKTLLDESIN